MTVQLDERTLFAIIDRRVALAASRSETVDLIRGTVQSVVTDLRVAMVLLDGGSTPLPAVYPALAVIPVTGDEVICQRRRADGLLVVDKVLGRDAVAASGGGSGTQVSYPDSPGAVATYLARIKKTADAAYRAELGLDSSDRPQLLLGDGTAVDLRAYRSGAKTLVVDDGAAGNLTLVNVLTASLQRAGNAVLDAASHGSSGDPHTQYALDSDLTTHAAAADPHTGYVLESLFDAAGDLITASADNTPLKLAKGANNTYLGISNAGALGYQTRSGCVATRSTTQSIPNTTENYVNFTDADTTDTDAYHAITGDASVNPNTAPSASAKFTMPFTGWYGLSCGVTFTGNLTGRRVLRLIVAPGGTFASNYSAARNRSYPTDTAAAALSAADFLYLTAGDIVTSAVTQLSGAALTITLASMTIVYLGA